MKSLILFSLLALSLVSQAEDPSPLHPPARDFMVEVAAGNHAGYSIITKFGHNGNVNGTLAPITSGGIYRTPSTSVTALELVSSNLADTAGGLGAQTVRVEGLGVNFEMKSVDVSMAGTTPVSAGIFMRVFRLSVIESGSYATATLGSHDGTITLRANGGGEVWGTIDIDSVTGFPLAQSEIGCYTIPAGYTGYLMFKHISVDANKEPTVFWFRRESSDSVSSPYSPMRLFERHVGVIGALDYNPPAPIIVLPEKTDVGAMGYVATGSAAVSVEFQILLIENYE